MFQKSFSQAARSCLLEILKDGSWVTLRISGNAIGTMSYLLVEFVVS